MPRNVIPIVTGADAHARLETERKRELFAWADRVLRELGFADRVKLAISLHDLHRIVFDPDAAEVALAIREALHPASGERHRYFDGIREGSAKRILKMR